jgi:hypothetical protein
LPASQCEFTLNSVISHFPFSSYFIHFMISTM